MTDETTALNRNVMNQIGQRISVDPSYIELLQQSTALQVQSRDFIVESDNDEREAADILQRIKTNTKRLEDMRTAKVAFPNRFVKIVNGMFKATKDENHKAELRIKDQIARFRNKREAEYAAAKQAQSEVAASCSTCGYANRDATPWECSVVQDGIVTIVHEGYSCEKYNPSAARPNVELPQLDGDPQSVATSPPPPPPPPGNVTRGQAGSVHSRKEWDYEITDFAKFVRAVGNNKKTELIPEELLSVNRSALLKIIRREENPVRKIAGLKIAQKTVVISK